MVKKLTLNAPNITGLCSQMSPLSPPFLLPLSSLSPQVTLLQFVPFDQVTKSVRGRYSGRFLEEKFIGKDSAFAFKAY